MSDSSTDDDPDRDIVDDLFAEIDGGSLTLDEAAAKHPHLKKRLEDALSIPRLVKSTHAGTVHKPPENFGEYRVVYEIARGGMGIVYRAYHDRLHRDVAVKTIGDVRDPGAARERFQREQTALACLHQTHIVPIYAAGSDEAGEYFVMPYIDGASLDRVLKAWGISSNGRTETETLFTLVQSTSNGTAERSTSAFVSTNGGSRSGRERSERRTVETAPTPALDPPKSDSYFRSAATVVANAADALEHAHRRSIFHRDLKPKNIMLGIDGRLWIIDFGLAAFLPQENDADLLSNGTTGTLTKGTVGTWSYMAPEQFALKADARTDVWGLAVTLYEILTLRCAYQHRAKDWQQAAAAPPPRHPATMNPATPPDLAAICWKGMAQVPEERYQSAGELADDLRRWLRDEPVNARPRPIYEKVLRWTVKHRVWGALIVSLAVALPMIIGLQHQMNVKAQTIIGLERDANDKAKAEIAEQKRQLLVRDVDAILQAEKSAGWSEKALKKIDDAAAIRRDETLRDAAFATLMGPDAELIRESVAFGASSAAYDAAGKRIVLGGLSQRNNRPALPAHVWNLDEPMPKPGTVVGAGLVAFRADGTPVQLVADRSGRLRLLNVVAGTIVKEYLVPSSVEHAETPKTTLGRNGDRVAASFIDDQQTFVWTETNAKPLRLPVGASAAAFSTDGAFIAIGSSCGETSIWSVADGTRLSAFTVSSHAVQNLAFSGRTTFDGRTFTGEFAVGGFGRCAVVELATGRPICFIDYDDHVMRSVEFAPDGATIVVNGVLFDATTGRRLLNLGIPDVFAFSPNGDEAFVGAGEFFNIPQISRRSLNGHRGVALLFGLTNVAKIAISSDAHLIAALSRDWHLAVWNVKSGRLVLRVDVPEGPFADNAAVALSPDGRQVAVASGARACRWEVESGRRSSDWTVPPGFSNGLAFTRDGGLILVRVELESMKGYPGKSYPYPSHSRVIRGRNLLGADPTKPLFEVKSFPRHCFGIALTPDGKRFIADGLETASPDWRRSVRLFDARTGREIRRFPLTHQHDYHSLRTDPTGAALVFNESINPARARIVVASNGETQGLHVAELSSIGPNAELWFGNRVGERRHAPAVFRGSEEEPFIPLTNIRPGQEVFSTDGRFLAFETTTGAVGVLDLQQVNESFQKHGLR